MKGAETERDPIRISSLSTELYLSSMDLAALLKVSDSAISKLSRDGVLIRRSDPYNSQAYVYPVWENVRRYLEHLQGPKEKARVLLLREKSRTQRVTRQRAELEMAIKKGKLVSIEEVVAEFTPKCLAIRHALERLLERGVSQAVVNEVLSIVDKAPEPRTSANGDAPRLRLYGSAARSSIAANPLRSRQTEFALGCNQSAD